MKIFAPRVAPTPTVQQRRGTSALNLAETKESTDSPDPLEPWSIRGITNMNAILAWDQSDQESP